MILQNNDIEKNIEKDKKNDKEMSIKEIRKIY